MPSDDLPFDALQHQLELEDSSKSRVTALVVRLGAALLPSLPSPQDKIFGPIFALIKDHLGRDDEARVELLLKTLMDEVRKQDEKIRQLFEAQDSRTNAAKDLLLDAARKSVNTRAKERVKRIGVILANGIAEPNEIDSDEIEEMMRVAMELSDQDVHYLGELLRIDRPVLEKNGRITRFNAHQSWENGFWKNNTDPSIDSVFGKLESYGLVSRIAPLATQSIMSDLQNRYALLPKGLRFVTLIQQQQME